MKLGYTNIRPKQKCILNSGLAQGKSVPKNAVFFSWESHENCFLGWSWSYFN
jgi:hypothetical protein